MQAWDPALERKIALKLLHRDNPAAIETMLREARAQASVDHPNVGKVYEVGELDGRPYIAMQLVEGRPLDEALVGRSVERKVAVVSTVAEAVQAAHAAGLIHRDLKPANVLVEEREDGELVPYVLDFGIAREQELPGVTRTGQMVGTPGYLSPEQARGDRTSVDRRSDVFSLGVILYELLAGETPFAAESAAESVVRLLQEEPPALQRAVPNISPDLATIVTRCLERDPSHRYDSAGALARDLNHWLAGEPIEARPIGVVARFARRARNKPGLTAAIAVAVLAVAVAAGIGITARQRAVAQARLADRFSRVAERMDNQLRLAHMLPPHDIRPDRERVQHELEAMRAEVAAGGSVAHGPGNLALGRGLLHLDRHLEAREHLQRAWDGGYQTPEVALALGRAHVELYAESLDQAERIRDPELRQAERERAVAEHAVPAQRLLQRSDTANLELARHDAELVGGLLSLAEGELASAAAAGERAAQEHRWFYEGHLLAARAALMQAGGHLESGSLDGAELALGRALDAFRAAGEIAPSDAEPALGTCRTNLQRLRLAWEASRADASAMQLVRTSCDHALSIDPGLSEAAAVRAEAGWTAARIVAREGGSPEELLRQAIGDAERALAVDPDSSLALAQLGNALWVRARWNGDRGEDPTADLARAVESLERAAALEPGETFVQLSLGHVLNDWGATKIRRGEDPTEVQDRARQNYLAALERGGSSRLYNGLCHLDSGVAYRLLNRGSDPTEALARAADACTRALEINPDYTAALNNLGLARWTEAEHLMNVGADASDALADAISRFESILEIDPGRPTTSVNLSNLLATLARQRFDQGQAPSELLQGALDVAVNVQDRFPDEHAFLTARVALLRGEMAARAGQSPEGDFDLALTSARRSEELGVGPAALMLQASTLARRAAWYASQAPPAERSAVAAAEAGLQVLERILELESEHVEALAERARLASLRADLAQTSGERDQWATVAASSAAAAIERRPALADELRSLAVIAADL